jgi:hypothetical protein
VAEYGFSLGVYWVRSIASPSEYPSDRRVWLTAIGVCKPGWPIHLNDAHEGQNPSCNNPSLLFDSWFRLALDAGAALRS